MDWVRELRGRFPVADRCVYLDAAYDMGGATFMREAAEWFFDEWSEAALQLERGGPGRARFFAMADATRRAIGALLGGAEERSVCFTHNTSEGISMAVLGFDFAPGDNIVTFRDDFPSVVGPCLNAARLRGVSVRTAESESAGPDDVDALWELIDERTRLVVVSHVRSATGYMLDLERLGGLCRSKGIFLIVDATQSIGTAQIDARRWGVSAISAAGYKCLLAGIDSAFLYCCPELAKRLTPLFVSYNDFISIDLTDGRCELRLSDTDHMKKLECGTIDVLGVAILKRGVDTLLDIGLQRIGAHISELYEQLYDGLKGLGYDIVTPRDPRYRSAVLAVRIHGDRAALYEHFKRGKVALSSSRHLRFGIPAFAMREDIDAALRVAAQTDIR